MLDTVKFAKLHKDAKIPNKRREDGCYDVYACFKEDYIIIPPHKTDIISTELASAFSSDYVILLQERGSTGTKGIGQRAGVIDSGYRGEWMIPITNHNDKPIIIAKEHVHVDTIHDYIKNNSEFMVYAYGKNYIVYPYEKAICQAFLVEVPKVNIEEVSYEELMAIPSERGTGKLGSTNK